MTNRIELGGCASDAIMHHLKGLGVFKTVVEQKKDPGATAVWGNGTLVLETKLSRDDLVGFFLDEYRPMPVVSPWNKDSQFYDFSVAGIKNHPSPRLAEYGNVVKESALVLDGVFPGYAEALESGEGADKGTVKEWKSQLKKQKAEIVSKLYNRLPESALAWLDAVAVVTPHGLSTGPILGSGGNDGRSDIAKLFANCVLDFVDEEKRGVNEVLVQNALFGKNASLADGGVVHFNPGVYSSTASGPTGDKAYTLSNPWDFVLCIEGTSLFGGSVRRRGNRKFAAFPFAMSSSWAGYDTACESENQDKGEIWLPLWDRPATYGEIKHVYSEGRVQSGKAEPTTGVGFAIALANLGAMRGISSFQRFGILKRKGDAHHVIHLGSLSVEKKESRVLQDIDPWLDAVRRARNLPKSMGPVLRLAEDAIIRFCMNRQPANLQKVLIAVGKIESQMAASGITVWPLVLSPEWIKECRTEKPEFRLAVALASMTDKSEHPIRTNMEPVKVASGRPAWEQKSNRAVWGRGDLVRNLIAILERRCVSPEADAHRVSSSPRRESEFGLWEAGNSVVPLDSHLCAPLKDVMEFLEGNVDDRKIHDLLLPLSFVDYARLNELDYGSKADWDVPDDVPEHYTCAKSNFPPVHPAGLPNERGVFEPSLIGIMKSGGIDRAMRIARRRLQVSGYSMSAEHGLNELDNTMSHRLLASLVFPIRKADRDRLLRNLVYGNRSEHGKPPSTSSPGKDAKDAAA